MNFQTTREMSYANNDQIQSKSNILYKNLKEYLETIKQDKVLFFNPNETVYIPDIHGDFVHLIITLYRHNLIDKELNLHKEYKYVFLGDFYDRTPDADVIDCWLNRQLKRNLNIYRLLGNHEFAFFIREKNGQPVISPSQDSIMDISNNFQITENLLKNIAEGNILAAYVCDRRGVARNAPVLYIHSYAINDDYRMLDLKPDSDITNFAITLNKRLKEHGQKSYEEFLHYKKIKIYNWEEIIKPFMDDPLFNIYTVKNNIHTSFLWRRTGIPSLKIYPCEIDIGIPENIYQIVGHTPVFSFDCTQPVNEPFVIKANKGTGKVQFSDVGIGYYYKANEFARPEVSIKTFPQESGNILY